jgi:hypothetical protein
MHSGAMQSCVKTRGVMLHLGGIHRNNYTCLYCFNSSNYLDFDEWMSLFLEPYSWLLIYFSMHLVFQKY